MDAELIRHIDRLQRLYDSLVKPEIGLPPVWLTTPYTHESFNGDSFSDVTSATKIENTGWSTTIPADAKALLIRIVARDSASGSTADLTFRLYPISTAATPTLACRLSAMGNDDKAECLGWVPCSDGDIWYKCNASGVDTLDVWLYVWAYCL